VLHRSLGRRAMGDVLDEIELFRAQEVQARHEILWVGTVEDDDLDLVVGLEQIDQALQAGCDLRIEEVDGRVFEGHASVRTAGSLDNHGRALSGHSGVLSYRVSTGFTVPEFAVVQSRA
jgi:hypothetical protein